MKLNELRALINMLKIIFNTDKDYVVTKYLSIFMMAMAAALFYVSHDAEKRDVEKIKEDNEVKDLTII